MKRISLFSVLVTIVFAALLFAVVALIQNNRKLTAHVELVLSKLASRNLEYRQIANRHAAELELLRKSTKLLGRIHQDPDHADIAAFIVEMEGGSLPCSVRYLPEAENRALFVYHEPFSDSVNATRPVHQRRSVQLIVDTQTLSIVDSVMHVGYRSESITESAGNDPVWKTHYEFSDDRKITYKILPTGFKEVK